MLCPLIPCLYQYVVRLIPFQVVYRAAVLGSTVVSPYVGMARKQNGGYNASISVQVVVTPCLPVVYHEYTKQ